MQGLPDVLTLGDLSVVYQPIVSLATMEPFAHEALVRSNSPHWINPPKLFDEAIQSRCVGALGRAIRELSTTALPRDATLSQRASERVRRVVARAAG